MVKIAIIFYSSYGHTYAMAKKVADGVNSVDGCEAALRQVAGEKNDLTRWDSQRA